MSHFASSCEIRVALLVIGIAAASACGDGAPGGPSGQAWPAGWVEFENQVLVLVNQHRAAGATCDGTAYPPMEALSMQAQLRTAARGHSQDMAAQSYFSHTGLDGRSPTDWARAAGYQGSVGENIAAGYSTPQAVVTGWMNSPGHCRNIMRSNYRVIGVGYVFTETAAYRHYWTQNFGTS